MESSSEKIAALFTPDAPPLVNIGCGQDVTIRQLAETVAGVAGFVGNMVFDRTKPDGTPRKLLAVGRLSALGWSSTSSLENGIALAYRDFLKTTR